MDPPPISAPANSLFPKLANPKLRLMCSYGGHIIPRPHDKSICYAGGDTRIVAVDRRTTAASLSSLTSYLSRTLFNSRPFSLKYKLPNEDLDSLISITTDDDLLNMIEELDRIESSPKPSRIRLFLFHSKPELVESMGSVLMDSMTESWFCDALKSAETMQRGQSADSGLDNGAMGLDCGAPLECEAKKGLVLGSMPESIVLETSSSFGSTGSSISMSNLSPIGVHRDDGCVNAQDKKVVVLSPDSIGSDNSTASAISNPQTTIYQHPDFHVGSTEFGFSFNSVGTDTVPSDPAFGIHMMKSVQLPPHRVSSHSDQIQHQQQMSYVQTGAHYNPQSSQLPISAYYPMYYSPLHQNTPNPYPANPPYPVYFVPIRPTKSCSTPMQCNFHDNATPAQSRPQMHPPVTMMAPPLASVLPESVTLVYNTMEGATPLLPVPSNQNQPPLMDLSEIHHSSQCIAATSIAAANYEKEYEDDLAYTQIYKSQPSAPSVLLSQYQTMTNAGTVLSETSKLLHGDNVK